MKVISAQLYKPDRIIVKSLKQLEELVELILVKEEDFIINWKEDNILKSELIVCTHIIARVKNNELKLVSEEV